MRKYNYYKPKYSILDKEHKENILKELPEGKNENALLWFKFSITQSYSALFSTFMNLVKPVMASTL